MIAGGAGSPPEVFHTGIGDLLMIVKVFLTNMKTSDTVRFLYPIEEMAARRYAYEVFYGSPTCDEETATDETVLEYTTLLDTTELVLSKGDA
jgi:hypothetical protein